MVYRPLVSKHLREIELSCLFRPSDDSPVLAAFILGGVCAAIVGIVFGALIVLFLVFEPLGLAEVWRRVRRAFHLWPFRT